MEGMREAVRNPRKKTTVRGEETYVIRHAARGEPICWVKPCADKIVMEKNLGGDIGQECFGRASTKKTKKGCGARRPDLWVGGCGPNRGVEVSILRSCMLALWEEDCLVKEKDR